MTLEEIKDKFAAEKGFKIYTIVHIIKKEIDIPVMITKYKLNK